MNQLETLLNSLIDMGLLIEGGLRCLGVNGNNVYFYNPEVGKTKKITKSLRWLVSLESGLWQFCVEKKLYKNTNIVYEKYFGINQYRNYYDVFFEYRLLESALVPEDKLEQFLLDNIKIEGMMN